MKISWNGNAANVGKFELRVNRANGRDKWEATIWLWLHHLMSTRDHASIDAARQWCERELLKLVEPMISQARAEGAAQEREVCLSELRKLAEKRDAMAENSEAPDFYRSQASVLRIVEDAIRARTDGAQ